MNDPSVFNAPWGTLLKAVTGMSILVLVGVPVIGVLSGPHEDSFWILGMVVMPLAILVGGAFFMIRGYVLTQDSLTIQRLGWCSRVDLSGLQSVEADGQAMSRSIRTCGNGGLFCFAGAFRNRKLGAYRAFATDPKRSVVLRFPNRTVVVTPDQPEAFIARVKELTNPRT